MVVLFLLYFVSIVVCVCVSGASIQHNNLLWTLCALVLKFHNASDPSSPMWVKQHLLRVKVCSPLSQARSWCRNSLVFMLILPHACVRGDYGLFVYTLLWPRYSCIFLLLFVMRALIYTCGPVVYCRVVVLTGRCGWILHCSCIIACKCSRVFIHALYICSRSYSLVLHMHLINLYLHQAWQCNLQWHRV